MRFRSVLGVVTLSILAFATPASAGVDVGSEAPDFGAGEYINTEPVKLSDLKGRLVFLEIFGTT